MKNFDINFRIEKSRKKLNAGVFRKQSQELLPGFTGAGVQVASAAIIFTIFNFFFSIMFEESTKIDVGFSLLHSKCSWATSSVAEESALLRQNRNCTQFCCTLMAMSALKKAPCFQNIQITGLLWNNWNYAQFCCVFIYLNKSNKCKEHNNSCSRHCLLFSPIDGVPWNSRKKQVLTWATKPHKKAPEPPTYLSF